jgi:hypothetical protein
VTEWQGWVVTVDWQVRHGVPTPVGLHLVAGDDQHVDSESLRRLPLARVLQATRADARRTLAAALEEIVESVPADAPTLQQYVDDRADALIEPLKGARTAGRSRVDYATVARVYAEARARGEHPTEAVRRHFKIPKENRSTAAKQVARARQLGYLPKTTRGRVGPITEGEKS